MQRSIPFDRSQPHGHVLSGAACCQNCAYFNPPPDEDGDDAKGECRLYPPALFHPKENSAYSQGFPDMKPDDWCGQFTPDGATVEARIKGAD